jgi:DHA1 family arabinose polymer transporter-like MFS transporter
MPVEKSYHKKLSLFALLLGGLGIGITEFVMMGLLEDIALDLHVTIPQAGYLISAYALGVVIGAPLLVLLAGNIAPKKLLLGLMVLFTFFNALSMFASGYNFLLLTRLLSGLPHGAFFGVGAVVASRLAEKGKEARAISVMFAGLTIANIAGVPLGTFIGHHVHWHYTFAIIAVIGIATILAIKAWMPPLPVAASLSRADQLSFFGKADAWLLTLTIAIGTGGLFCWFSYISPLLTKMALFTEDSVSYILILAGLGMFAGNWIGGRLADKFSPSHAVIALLLGMCASLLLVYVFADNQAVTLVMTFVTGAVAFALIAPIQLLIIHASKGLEMLAAAVSQAAFNIGNALGALLGGIPLVHGYRYNSPELVGIGMALTGALIAYVFVLRQKKARATTPIHSNA